MRAICFVAIVGWFAAGLPAAAQTSDAQPQSTEDRAPPAPDDPLSPANLLPSQGSFDVSALSSLLGQLLAQGPTRTMPASGGTASQVVPSNTQTRSETAPAAQSSVPYSPGYLPPHPGHMSRDAFHQRIYAKRMALVNRIRAAAESSGNEQMAAQATQLEVLVNKVHNEGLGGIVQMLGQLQAARQSENAAPSTPPAVVPEEDLGEAAPLTLDDAPAAAKSPDTAPPKPQPDGEPELPPALPVP